MPELPDHVRTVLDALVAVARPIILTQYGPDSCIASTRIGIDALAYFGVTAKPVPVTLMIFNAEAIRVLEQTKSMEALGVALKLTPPDATGGAWSLGVGLPAETRDVGAGAWPGHLVIGLQQYSVLADLSLDQAARPLKDIATAPTWYQVPQSWWIGNTTDAPAELAMDGGAHMMVYRTSNQQFRVSPNWKSSCPVQREVTGQVIVAMRDRGISTLT